MRRTRPLLLVMSPMCTYFSAMQNLSKDKRDPEVFKLNYDRAVSHLRFALELCEIQREGGRHYLLEHPLSASSWKEPCMIEFLACSDDATLVSSHMCQFGMTQIGDGGEPMPILKPTRWLTNSTRIATALNRKCDG